MTTNELIENVSKITKENIDFVERNILKLSDDQRAWRPNPGIWSVRDVLAHLNTYAGYYHPAMLKKIENTRFTSTKEAFTSSPLGRSAWKSMKLGNANNIKRKFKAPKGTNPMLDKELIKGSESSDFISGQKTLLEIIEKASQVNLRRVKIPISISKIIRLRLGDALLFIVYHNQRHMQQINNLITHPNFPRK